MTLEAVLEATKDVFALLTQENKETLYHYAHQVPEGGVILDIGTAGGGSAFIMALASHPSVTVYTCDPQENENFFHWKTKLGLESKVLYSMSTSGALEWHKPIDLLFIDGVHNYDGVQKDFNKFSPFFTKDAIVAFHDIVLYGNTIGKFIEDMKDAGKLEEIETDMSEWEDKGPLGLFVGRKI